jgi:hypothetical protein
VRGPESSEVVGAMVLIEERRRKGFTAEAQGRRERYRRNYLEEHKGDCVKMGEIAEEL